jgi:hypothetical protein
MEAVGLLMTGASFGALATIVASAVWSRLMAKKR